MTGALAQAADAAPSGGLAVPAGATQPGSVILVRGPVDVYGTVRGDVLTLFGDVVVHPGAHVDGTAASLFGRATRQDVATQAPAAPATPPTVAAALGVPLAWFLLLAALGAAVATRAEGHLRAVREVVEQRPGRALAVGIAGQFFVIPALLLLIAALGATLVGIIVVPLAIVGFVVAVAGLATLGFLAAAAVLGRALVTRRGTGAAASPRSPTPVLVGLGLLLALWLLAGAVAGVPIAALLARTLAAAATWITLSAGFGAALVTRAESFAGRRRALVAADDDVLVTDRGVVPAWQTPTPIATLVGARPVASGAASRSAATRLD